MLFLVHWIFSSGELCEDCWIQVNSKETMEQRTNIVLVFEREGGAGCWEGRVWKEYSSELTKVWSCLKLLLTKVSKLDSRGLKEVPVVCATEADWVVIVCFLLKIILAAPVLRRSCMSQNCHRQVAGKESYDMVIGVFSFCNVSICCVANFWGNLCMVCLKACV